MRGISFRIAPLLLTALISYTCGGGGSSQNTQEKATNPPAPQPPPTQPPPTQPQNPVASAVTSENGLMVVTLLENNAGEIYFQTKAPLSLTNSNRAPTVVLPATFQNIRFEVRGDPGTTYKLKLLADARNILSREDISIRGLYSREGEFIVLNYSTNILNILELNFLFKEGKSVNITGELYKDGKRIDSINFRVYINKLPEINPANTQGCPIDIISSNTIRVRGSCIEFEIEEGDKYGRDRRVLIGERVYSDLRESRSVRIDYPASWGNSYTLVLASVEYIGNKEDRVTRHIYLGRGVNTQPPPGDNNPPAPPTNNPPEINLWEGSPASGYAPLSVNFSWNIGDNDGDNLTCYLDYDGDGNTDETINNCPENGSASHTYNNPGTYNAKLTVSDGKDAVSKIYQVIVNQYTAPTINVSVQPTLMKDGSTAYKYYVNETINGSIQGFYGSVTNTSLTCYLDFNNDGTPDQTINNCENAQNFTVSYPSPGTYTIKATVTDGVDSSTATQTVSVYDYPAIVASWDPGLIFLGGSSTFSVYVINTGIVDDNVSECLLTVDLHCDGYINTTINGCSTGVVYSITDTPPIDGTRTDCAEFEDYRGTKVSGSATLIVLP